MRILLTGGAGGIGRALTDRLVSHHDVVAFDRDVSGLETLPDSVDTHVVDLTDETQVRASIPADIDALVSCVGWYELGAIEDCSPDSFRDHLEANLLAVHTPVQTLLPTLREREGQVVVVGSMLGSVPLPYHGAYSASKAGLAGYLDSLRREVKPRGVDVSLIEPGPVRTGFNERAASALERHTESAYAKQYHAFDSYTPGTAEPTAVVDTVEKAIDADSPRASYRVGRRARWLPRLDALLPSWLFDRLVRSGIPGGRLHRLIDR